jgi:predicted nuclease of predicted toxin-antitoxin system
MLLLVSDENFNNDIVRGLLRRKPDLDIIRVQDVGLRGQDDPTILEWAAQERRVVLTHDAATMTYFAYERVRVGKSMPGVIEVSDDLPVIEDILLLAEYSDKGEWEG